MVRDIALAAKDASESLRLATTAQKNAALEAIAQSLELHRDEILDANAKDLENAETSGIPVVMRDRLRLDTKRIAALSAAVRAIAALPDPIGAIEKTIRRPNGLLLQVKRVPLGLIGIIFESRPNVTVDSAVLCIKSGNAALLRGGKDAIVTNLALAKAIQEGLKSTGLPPEAVSLIEDTSRDSAMEMMGLTGVLDVLIPRGGAGLIRTVVENARVPIIETGSGNCHIYIDAEADLDMALNIVDNAKCQRPSVCNACETVLVSKDVANEFLPRMKQKLDTHHVELRGCPATVAILPDILSATEEDWATEYNDYILAVRVVEGLYQATAHINRYGTKHSESIITKNLFTANRFAERVDSACVYINASTRFSDGEEFGFGGEIGISTQKLHARGPMGLEHLTSIQYVIHGEGQVR